MLIFEVKIDYFDMSAHCGVAWANWRKDKRAHTSNSSPPMSGKYNNCKYRATKIYISSGAMLPHQPSLHLFCLIHKTQRNKLHLSSTDCGQTNWPVCSQIASLTVINHNYRAHGSCINIPSYPPLTITPPSMLLGVARPPFGGQYTPGDNSSIIYLNPLPPFY